MVEYETDLEGDIRVFRAGEKSIKDHVHPAVYYPGSAGAGADLDHRADPDPE